MNIIKNRMLAGLAVLLLCYPASAQTSVSSKIGKLGALIDTLLASDQDPHYVETPKRPWQVMLTGSMSQTVLGMNTAGTIAGVEYNARPRLKTEPAQYVGVWAGYKGYGLGYEVLVGGDKGEYLTFDASDDAWSASLSFHSFENNSPNFNLNSGLIVPEEQDEWLEVQLTDPIKVHTVIANGIYLFNHKRFSYSAAYDQSAVQKRSAGSLIAGAMYCYGSIDYASPKNGDLIYLMHGLGKVKLWQGCVGVGYTYNWVPTRGLLINAMAMPMVTVVNRIKVYGYSTNVEELMQDPTFWDYEMEADEWDQWLYDNMRIAPMGNKTFNSRMAVNIDARLSVTYNFGRYFVNAYGQFGNVHYSSKSSHGHLNDWYFNASIGIRL